MVTKVSILLRIAIASSVLFFSVAQAQLFRAYLAADGNDGNPCTLQAPCRLLPAALNVVASGGEIWMLDSANYNTATVNINKSVSILAVPGAVGSLVATGGAAINIFGDGMKVALRNLVIAPVVTLPGGTSGVLVSGASLSIENCLIANLPEYGVRVFDNAVVNVVNTTLLDNGLAAIFVGGVSSETVTVSESRLLSNGGGVEVRKGFSSATVSIAGSIISGGSFGVKAVTGLDAGALARISVARSTIERTGRALYSTTVGLGVAGTTEINVGSSLIVDNDYSWYQEGAGSSILSLGNNQMSGNGGSFGVLTPLPPQ